MVRIIRLPSPVVCLVRTPDGARLVAGAKDGHLREFDGDGDRVLGDRLVARGQVTAASAAREAGKILVGTSEGTAAMQAR
jgi:hypothetical protein